VRTAKEAIMRRRRLIIAAVLVAAPVAVLLNVPAALAGGGCHEAATDARGTTVTMRNLCYSPTVLRVPEGETVTFVNKDDMEHPTAGRGTDWSTDGKAGSSAVVKFDKAGIYPYFCYQHIGMVGVVVVGDGIATGTGAGPVKIDENTAAQSAAAQSAAAVPAEPAAARGSAAWSLPGAIVLVLALGFVTATVVVVRRRQTRGGPAAQA
jgi:plastocyanin